MRAPLRLFEIAWTNRMNHADEILDKMYNTGSLWRMVMSQSYFFTPNLEWWVKNNYTAWHCPICHLYGGRRVTCYEDAVRFHILNEHEDELQYLPDSELIYTPDLWTGLKSVIAKEPEILPKMNPGYDDCAFEYIAFYELIKF